MSKGGKAQVPLEIDAD